MRKFLSILLMTVILSSCSTDDDSYRGYPRVHDVSFSVTSTDNDRFSTIEVEIMNIEDEVRFSSYSNVHLPMEASFANQEIQEFTILEMSYIDDSGGAVGVSFEPYSVTIKILLDSKIIAEKKFTVTESGHAASVNYTFQ